MKPRILVVEQMDPEVASASGIDNIIRDFIRYGSEEFGFSIVGISSTREIGVWHSVEIGSIAVPFFPVASLSKTSDRKTLIQRLPHSFQVVLGLLRYRRKIRRHPFDMLQVHRAEIGPVASAILSGPYSLFVHNATSSLVGSSSESRWSKAGRLYGLMLDLAAKRALGTGVFNKVEAERLAARHSNVIRCRTWFDPQLFFPPRHSTARAGGIRVAWVGRLESQKDPLLAIAAISHLVSTGVDVALEMVGDGSLRRSVERAIEDSLVPCTLHGTLDSTAVAEVYRSCSVFLMTSHFEGSPTVLVEAAATGLPVVCTTGADPDNIVVDGANGFRTGRDAMLIGLSIGRAFDELRDHSIPSSILERSAPNLPLEILRTLHEPRLDGPQY